MSLTSDLTSTTSTTTRPDGSPHPLPAATVLGYPRIGPDRELKRAVEAYWAGRLDAAGLEHAAADLRRATRERLVALGLPAAGGAVPESFSFYDQVLDAAFAVGALPERFRAGAVRDGADEPWLDRYFAAARGDADRTALEMTKWFDTNYHYLVPEIGPSTPFALDAERLVAQVREAREAGVQTRPVVVGPVSLLLLAKPDGLPGGDPQGLPDGAAPAPAAPFDPLDRLGDLVPVYADLLRALAAAGASWVQLDESALVADHLTDAGTVAGRTRAQVLGAVTAAYRALATELPLGDRPAILLQASYGDLGDALPVVAATDVEAVALDLVRGSLRGSASDPAPVPGLETKTVVAGVVDGRNVWRADLAARLELLGTVRDRLGAGAVVVGTSTSLQHVPHDTARESWTDGTPAGATLDRNLHDWLAFADQKVAEVEVLARGLTAGGAGVNPGAVRAELDAATSALASRAAATGVRVDAVRARTAALTEADRTRGNHTERVTEQAARLGLPPLPTTTIGSFPQTPEIRRARAAHARGELTDAAYDDAMRAEIARVVALQEELGLDVLVHGEAERNDMVQYFAELLDGFAVTRDGWVQSYGTRCTRPSILWGDVSRPAPMTVRWTTYAQSLTQRPLKGMLTGPVTIMAWSFVRDDVPLAETADQIGLALRDEVADLEAAGIGVVQVDEPALRELLPLRRADQPAYLGWSVGSFRLATAGVRTDTQVHTHLCYSELGEVIGAIDALDADVTSIEAARSRMEIVPELRDAGFDRGVGPGVYDIHSPRVPAVAEMVELLGLAARSVDPALLWVNPDCGLKTRGYAEVTPALEHLVAAAREVRAAL